jgi:hypothetical protein
MQLFHEEKMSLGFGDLKNGPLINPNNFSIPANSFL